MRLLSAYEKAVPQVELGLEQFNSSPTKYFFGNSEPDFSSFSNGTSQLCIGLALLADAALVLVMSWKWRKSCGRPHATWRLVVGPLAIFIVAMPAGWCLFNVFETLLEQSKSLPYLGVQRTGIQVKSRLDAVRTSLEDAVRADGYVTGEMGIWGMSTVPGGKTMGRAGFTQAWKPSPFDRWHWRGGILVAASPQLQLDYVSAEGPRQTTWVNGQSREVTDPSVETWAFVSISLANRNLNSAEATAILDRLLAAAKSAETRPPAKAN